MLRTTKIGRPARGRAWHRINRLTAAAVLMAAGVLPFSLTAAAAAPAANTHVGSEASATTAQDEPNVLKCTGRGVLKTTDGQTIGLAPKVVTVGGSSDLTCVDDVGKSYTVLIETTEQVIEASCYSAALGAGEAMVTWTDAQGRQQSGTVKATPDPGSYTSGTLEATSGPHVGYVGRVSGSPVDFIQADVSMQCVSAALTPSPSDDLHTYTGTVELTLIKI
ncbi:hypothetical protein C8D88_1265 [Lentzea atacamensis]|uniref:Ig-like domain-containing protein n=1 Tax=Lentzea atacamensis TaxID=531938 RepID=A0A316HEM1_9PSEU|nr:hypothetical protein C8D88_1265 [Lentzea atacamensis]